FGNPVAGRHERLEPFDAGYRRSIPVRFRALRDRAHARLQFLDDGFAAIGDFEGAGDAPDVVPDVDQRIGGERYDARLAGQARGQRGFDVFQADSADLALRLRDDVCRLEAFQDVGEDYIYRERVANAVLYETVDFAAVAGDRDCRARADG